MAALQARSPCEASRGGDHLDVGEVEPGRQRALALQSLQRGNDAAVHERVDVHRDCRDVNCVKWSVVSGELGDHFNGDRRRATHDLTTRIYRAG